MSRFIKICLLSVALVAACARGPVSYRATEKEPVPDHGPEPGHSIGNGSDLSRPEDGAAWFVGADRKIPACIEVSNDFGWDATELKTLVEKSWEAWTAYQDTKQIQILPREGTLRPLFPQGIEWQRDCKTARLRLLFGVLDDRVKADLANGPQRLAFAMRTDYDASSRWGAGYIWFTGPGTVDRASAFPNWRSPDFMNAIVTHELGHVLGCGHVEGTVMDAKLGERLHRIARGNAAPSDLQFTLSQIDQSRELFFCSSCRTRYVGDLPSHEIFKSLVGREHVGVGYSVVNLGPQGRGLTGSWVLYDDLGETTFKLDANEKGVVRAPSSVPIFKIASRGSAPGSDLEIFQAQGGDVWEFWAKILTPSGVSYPVQLQFNVGTDTPSDIGPNTGIQTPEIYRTRTVPFQIQGTPETFQGSALFEGMRL